VDGLESVRTTLERLFEQHDEVAASLSASRTVVEQTIVRMILAGELHSEEEISGTLSYAGIELRAPWITSIILERVPSGLRSAKDVALASRQLSSQAVQVRLVAPGYRGSLTGLALVDSSDQQTASDLLVQRLRRADELGAAKVAVGGFKPSLVEAHRSLMEAEQALSRLHSSPGLVVWYTQVPRRSGQYYLPFELEGRLITAARHGSLQLVDQVLGEIRTENFESAAVVPAQCEILLATLEGIVQRVESEAELVTALPTADEDDGSPIRRFDNLTERFRAVCAALGASHGPTAAAMEEARRIVESEYGNTQIGLGYVADRLHLSEAYLSRAFKKVVGENFYSYLTRVRMRVAQDLLEAGTVSISDVWKKVGYTSGRGFARAFRSYSGRSPAEYRGSVGNADRN